MRSDVASWRWQIWSTTRPLGAVEADWEVVEDAPRLAGELPSSASSERLSGAARGRSASPTPGLPPADEVLYSIERALLAKPPPAAARKPERLTMLSIRVDFCLERMAHSVVTVAVCAVVAVATLDSLRRAFRT